MDWRKQTLEPEDVVPPACKKLKSLASASWKTATLDGHAPMKTAAVAQSWKQMGLTDEEAPSAPSAPSALSSSSRGSNVAGSEKPEPRVVALTGQIIACIPTEVKSATKYSEAGKSKDRLSALLQIPCKCAKRTCFQQFNMKELRPLLNLWHGLTNTSKISILTALSHDLASPDAEDNSSDLDEGRRSYSLSGKEVCFKAFASILGHSERTLLKYISGQPDLRRSSTSVMPRSKDQTMFCHMFFAELYQTAAEDLPEKPVLDKSCSIDDHIASAGQEEASVDSVEYSKHFVWMLEAPIAELMSALLKCGDSAHTRTLPPGEISDLWQQFLAWSQNLGRRAPGSKLSEEMVTPGWSTFYRAWTGHWHVKRGHKLLEFRKKSQHAECEYCATQRGKLHDKRLTMEEKLQLAAAWRSHLHNQYHDRCLYWALRFTSRQHQGILTIIADSLDKGKCGWPKYEFARVPADLDKLQRPRCEAWLELQVFVIYIFLLYFF